MSVNPITIDELIIASQHVDYELRQLIFCALQMNAMESNYPGGSLNGFPELSDQLMFNTFITAFTVHARNLYCFLYNDEPTKEKKNENGKAKIYRDITADLFFNSRSEWTGIRPPVQRVLKAGASYLVNNHSAHLTMRRAKRKPPRVRYPGLMLGLIRLMGIFVEYALWERLDPFFIDTIYLALEDPASALI
ncbi:MAG: hypothetical protein U0452_08895 [Anaerolineae bacterium]